MLCVRSLNKQSGVVDLERQLDPLHFHHLKIRLMLPGFGGPWKASFIYLFYFACVYIFLNNRMTSFKETRGGRYKSPLSKMERKKEGENTPSHKQQKKLKGLASMLKYRGGSF